jgi:hypothetical protein
MTNLHRPAWHAAARALKERHLVYVAEKVAGKRCGDWAEEMVRAVVEAWECEGQGDAEQ